MCSRSIHWAGTETATLWCGYMSGAVQSGQRVALEVLFELCPSTLTNEEQEEVQMSHIVKDPPLHTNPNKRTGVRIKTVVAAAVALSALVFLSQRQAALDKVKLHFTNIFSAFKSKAL